MTAHSTQDQLTPVRPWGIGRLAPYPTTVKLPFNSITIDPATQTGVFRDHLGHPMEMGKHGTSSGTETSTSTNLDSQPDEGHDQDSEQD
ncbi:putative ATP-grasp-modified RiPP [Streptomyces sp. CA-210063]|uniref:putative ATP-grasp-modified RiPP n=1 Tax=Streptomyces sp. CA-210063 TaxID=2801029 RepID=UPI00214BE62D|nr:putative ATP-grasp-modified RiPP [Streptomyces sp. CA-210063]UUU33640.1 putative ATP-grasp-modified RiPP [Streptomyces sp. CA-210063]